MREHLFRLFFTVAIIALALWIAVVLRALGAHPFDAMLSSILSFIALDILAMRYISRGTSTQR